MIGILSAFGACISWTYACFIWREQTIKYSSIDINFVKNIIAFLVFLPAFINFNFTSEIKVIITLLISGIIGIGLGDTFYIKSLSIFGTRKTLSVESISPILAALSGKVFINENLSIRTWIGIIIVSISLFLILKDNKNSVSKQSKVTKEKNNIGIYLFPFLSVLCAVIGGLLSRKVFLISNFSPLETTEIRLVGAIFFLLTITKLKFNFFLKELSNKNQMKFFLSIMLGTNIGILLQQVVFKTLPLGIGWTLLSTSPVISLLFAKKEEGNIKLSIKLFTGLLFLGLCIIIL